MEVAESRAWPTFATLTVYSLYSQELKSDFNKFAQVETAL